MEINNRLVVITGAGSGLGAATARKFIQEGWKTILVDLNEQSGNAIAGELGERAKFIQADVTDEESAKNVFKHVAEFGRLRGLVNCAGIAYGEKVSGKAGAHQLDSFKRTININLIGSFNMLRLAAEAMTKLEADEAGERGVIINTASVAAFDGQIGQAAYAASKGGVAAMTLPIARELASSGIRVMAIAPGIMETPMLAGLPVEVQESLGKIVPFPSRLGKPSEFAELVFHIFSNQYLNGEVIRIDGSIRMTAK
jgi:NAD(P)-dependent dehydrogenase (short-subunit alcohol dehydrogenase family)